MSIPYGLSDEFIGLPFSTNQNESLNFIYVGQYTERKGVQDILTLFTNCVYPYKLTFIINKDGIAQAKRDFKDLNNVSFYPWMDRNKLIEHYQRHDIFLMTSYGEGFGKTNLEAMACGLCILGYKEGALSDIGIHKNNSLLAEPGDFNALSANFEWCFQNKAEVRKISKRAYKEVQSLTWERFAHNTVEELHKLY